MITTTSFDELYEYQKSVISAKRTGWSLPRSKKKSNEVISINRQELLKILDDAICGIKIIETLGKSMEILESIADQHGDGVKCAHCLSVYRPIWNNGICPYCK